MECSVCKSTNLVKVSLAYEQGLSEYKGRSRSRGLSLGTGGMGLWGGSAKTTGTFQTRLSARLSPPTKMSYWKTTVWWFAGVTRVVVRCHRTDAGQCSQGEGIQPRMCLGCGCLWRRPRFSVVSYLAIQPPGVSGSARALGPFLSVPTMRENHSIRRIGERRRRVDRVRNFGTGL